MTLRIVKSDAAQFGDFAALVSAHAKEVQDWRERELLVERDRLAGIPAGEAYESCPEPRAHEIIEAAINADGQPDFIIVDDGPTPEQILSAKKDAFSMAVNRAVAEEETNILPPRKRALFAQRRDRIARADDERLRAATEKVMAAGFLQTMTGEKTKLIEKIANPEKMHAEERPVEDQEFIVEHRRKEAQVQALSEWAAQMHSDIEDLTADEIDSWVMSAPPSSKES